MRQRVAGGVTLQVAPPGPAVTVYEVGASPEPRTTVILAAPSSASAVGVPGVPGGATIVKLTSLVVAKYLGFEFTAAAVALTTQVPTAL